MHVLLNILQLVASQLVHNYSYEVCMLHTALLF